jgi:diaminopimelate decarboxylase
MTTHRDIDGRLSLGGVPLADLAGDPRIGTPSYVYDLDGMAAEARAIREAFEGAPHLVAYAVKANSAGPVVRALASEGCGADVVSGAELELALGCGVTPDEIVYSGVAKTDGEIDRALAAGSHGILAIQVESVEELGRVDARARVNGRAARVAIRVNPGVDKDAVGTHAHVTTGHDEAKFGIARTEIAAALSITRASDRLELVGISAHVGSQLTAIAGYLASARAVFEVARAAMAQGAPLRFVDTGGGFGIDYGEGCAARPADFVRAARAEQRAQGVGQLALHVEPGRALVGAHGVLLARVIQEKVTPERSWLIIDAGMNDLIRPALYQARHRVVSLHAPGDDRAMRVVGPVCESSDDFGEHRGVAGSSLVALLDAGAYGFTMASRYNGRQLPAEVFLRGGRVVALAARDAPGAWADSRLAIREEPTSRP